MFIFDNVSGGIQKYRIQDPHIFLYENLDYDIEFGGVEDAINSDQEKFFLHFSSLQNPAIRNFIDNTLTSGKKIILDIDDFWEVPMTHYLYQYNKFNKTTETLFNYVGKVTAVICSTEQIYKALKKYNNNIFIVPNSLNYEYESKHVSELENNKFTIGWAGSSSHVDDMKLMSKIGILSKMKNIQFILAGFDNRQINPNGGVTINNNGVWSEYEHIITNNYNLVDPAYKNYLMGYNKQNEYLKVDEQNYRRLWSMDIRAYLKIMNQFDVFIVPLVNNAFNKYKSELKLIESALHKIPVVASDLPQYSAVLKACGGGFIVDNSKAHRDFIKSLKMLQNEKELREDMGERLYEYCSEHFDYKKTGKQRLDIYNLI